MQKSEPLQERRPSWPLWTIAAVAAVGLHVGGVALALAHLYPNDDSDGLSANVSVIDVDLMSPAAEETELPPGPDVDASPELAAQKAEVKPIDVPKETPKESDEPDRVVKLETVQTAASQQSVAQEASAQQKLDNARVANVAAAPNLGIGKDNRQLTAKWGKQISAYFELHKRYPKTENVKAAKVTLNLVLNRQGHVVSLAVVESSGDPLYDEAAKDMVRRSDPVPRPPAALTDDTFSYNLPVDFKGRK